MSSFRLGLIVIAIVMAGLFLVYVVLDPLSQACFIEKRADPALVCTRHTEFALVLTLISSALVTFFGILALPGAQSEDGSYREQRIRFAIAATILVVYLLYFCMSVFWSQTENPKMVETLTNLMMVVIPFYFGASAVAQVVGKKEEKGK